MLTTPFIRDKSHRQFIHINQSHHAIDRGGDMLHQLRRIQVAFGLSLALAAITTAPASALLIGPGVSTLTAPTHSSTLPSTSPCSEVCSGGAASYRPPTLSTTPTQPTVVRVVRHDTGFDWGDAAIGAGTAAAILLIVGGGLTATATRRARQLGGSSATLAS
jgi:hypothetical protein